jgi:hypothetical protein
MIPIEFLRLENRPKLPIQLALSNGAIDVLEMSTTLLL